MWSRGSWLGDPGFRMVLCCFSHLCGLVCVCFPLFFVCFLAVLAILGCDDTKLPSLHVSTNELGASHACVLGFGLFCLLFGFVFCLFLFCVSLLFVWFMMMTAQWTMYRSFPSSLLRLNSRLPGTLICNYCSCNVIQCGKRPGESHEGVGRKRDLSDLARFHKSEQVSQKYFLSIMQEIEESGECGMTDCLSEAGQHNFLKTELSKSLEKLSNLHVGQQAKEGNATIKEEIELWRSYQSWFCWTLSGLKWVKDPPVGSSFQPCLRWDHLIECQDILMRDTLCHQPHPWRRQCRLHQQCRLPQPCQVHQRCLALQSCSWITPARSSVCCNEA